MSAQRPLKGAAATLQRDYRVHVPREVSVCRYVDMSCTGDLNRSPLGDTWISGGATASLRSARAINRRTLTAAIDSPPLPLPLQAALVLVRHIPLISTLFTLRGG